MFPICELPSYAPCLFIGVWVLIYNILHFCVYFRFYFLFVVNWIVSPQNSQAEVFWYSLEMGSLGGNSKSHEGGALMMGSVSLGKETPERSHCLSLSTSLLLFSCSVMSNSLRPYEQQHAGIPCPSLSPEVCSNSYPFTTDKNTARKEGVWGCVRVSSVVSNSLWPHGR